MGRLERLRQVNLQIQDPDTPEDEVRQLIDEGVAVVSQSFGLHSTEVAGAQTPPELVYDLVTRNDRETQRILDNTVMLLFPNFNPDGQIMVTDWYYENRGTEYEGIGLGLPVFVQNFRRILCFNHVQEVGVAIVIVTDILVVKPRQADTVKLGPFVLVVPVRDHNLAVGIEIGKHQHDGVVEDSLRFTVIACHKVVKKLRWRLRTCYFSRVQPKRLK